MEKRKISREHDSQAPAKSIYTELVAVSPGANAGLQNASGDLVEKILGAPKSIEMQRRTQLIDVGPFEVEGFELALESLKDVMLAVNEKFPDLYKRLGHNGMRVIRSISGKKAKSLHSWGIAIDITIDGIEDVKWNEKSFYGLALLAPIFHEHGWYWGGAFQDQETEEGSGIYHTNEDSMHFEISKNKLIGWARYGYLGPAAQKFANGKEFLKLRIKDEPAKSKENRWELTTRLLLGMGSFSTNPIMPKPLPTSNVLMKPLPRRTGEPYSRWLGRTAASLAKNPSSWFR